MPNFFRTDQHLSRTGQVQINANNKFSLLLYAAIDEVISLSLYYHVWAG